MESLSFGKRNLMRTGNSAVPACRVPRQSAGIARQLSRKVLPENGPFANRESNDVSQASPRGCSRFTLSGNHGARERWPQMRGLKNGSRRERTGFISSYDAASAREK